MSTPNSPNEPPLGEQPNQGAHGVPEQDQPQQGQPYGQPPYSQPPQQGQPYGQQPYGESPFGAVYAPRGKRKLPLILGGVAALVVIVVVALGFIGPAYFTSKVFDQNALQSGVQGVLMNSYGQKVDSVSCPAQQKVRTGSTFTCQATVGGKQQAVTITVKDDGGTYEVARP